MITTNTAQDFKALSGTLLINKKGGSNWQANIHSTQKVKKEAMEIWILSHPSCRPKSTLAHQTTIRSGKRARRLTKSIASQSLIRGCRDP
ncbi:hypothetical protein CDL12_04642 [Handroanthus impetiginosus]|uniref:Uncharacterized protein n=1 Tax=Handroanthus impetiginosus TaxID=429701 RepID=A0A2G9HYP5_9LAMI|nr:hypothetical protein CDL12_04642 [Handroanthus impetiginosus]